MKHLDRDVYDVATRYLVALDTPISLGVYLRMKYGEWDDLAAMRVNPLQYLDSPFVIEKFRRDYQAVSLLRKYPGLPIRRDLKKEAVESFYASEKHNKLSNLRLSYLEHPVGISSAVLELLHRVRKNMKRILGSLPESLEGRFGPGTVFEFGGSHSAGYRTPSGKMSEPVYCTQSSAAVVEHAVAPTMWFRQLLIEQPSKSALRVVRGNRFTTVPKSAVQLRGICVEPGGLVFTQLAVGEYIRNRLKHRTGIDILSAQEKHTMMACSASLSGSHATIDLSSASDTMCKQVVKLALGYSEDWWSLLSVLRSPLTRVNGKWVHLEKFSSMGNGFTFELETALFHSIACAASNRDIADPDVRVYGDDIIVPSEDADNVLSALRMFGFMPNERKTFLTGPFRESCGGDYFMGARVTPYYLKSEPLEPSDWIGIANGLYADVRCGLPSSLRARSKIGLALRIYGPRDLGDIVIHERDPRRWTKVWRNGIRWIRAWKPFSHGIPLERYSPGVQLASALYGVPSSGPVPRDSVAGYRYRWVAFS